MEASPLSTADLDALKLLLGRIKGVSCVSELHVWSLGHSRNCLIARIHIESNNGQNVIQLLETCEKEIMRKHPSIKFVNLQPVSL